MAGRDSETKRVIPTPGRRDNEMLLVGVAVLKTVLSDDELLTEGESWEFQPNLDELV